MTSITMVFQFSCSQHACDAAALFRNLYCHLLTSVDHDGDGSFSVIETNLIIISISVLHFRFLQSSAQ